MIGAAGIVRRADGRRYRGWDELRSGALPAFGQLVVILEVYADAFPEEDVAARFPIRTIPQDMYGPLTRRVRKAIGDGVPIPAEECQRFVRPCVSAATG